MASPRLLRHNLNKEPKAIRNRDPQTLALRISAIPD